MSGLAVGLALAMVFLVSLGARETEAREDAKDTLAEAQQKGSLYIAKRTNVRIKGSFGYAGSLITFNSKHENPSRVAARLEINGVPIEVSRNPAASTVTLDGKNKTLFYDDIRALAALSKKMERKFTPIFATGGTLPPQEDVLYRAVGYYAEAPLGYTLSKQVVKNRTADKYQGRPTPLQARVDFVNVAYSYKAAKILEDQSIPSLTECRKAKLTGNFSTYVACQQNGQDGRRQLQCKLRTYRLWHDSRYHCYRSWRRYTGPCTRQCIGRCGPGCYPLSNSYPNIRGFGKYYRDCAEHDRCVRHDNTGIGPFNYSCGDEFREAADDHNLGKINCRRCWR